jgi:hypothetical protein
VRFAVYLYFIESGREVYAVEAFEDRWAAECYLAGCAGEITRGGRTVPLTRARIVTE